MNIRTIIAGALATRAMTDAMLHAEKFGLPQVDPPSFLGSLFNGGKSAPKGSAAWKGGMAIHYILGSLIFPTAFQILFKRVLPGNKTAKSVEYAVGLWATGQYVVWPLMSKYHYFEKLPDAKLTYLMGHLIYGTTFGTSTNA